MAKKLIPIIWDLMIPEIEKWLKKAVEEIGESQKNVLLNHLHENATKHIDQDV